MDAAYVPVVQTPHLLDVMLEHYTYWVHVKLVFVQFDIVGVAVVALVVGLLALVLKVSYDAHNF